MLSTLHLFCFVLAANSNYELGTGDKVGGWRPRLISSLEEVRIVQIACGGYHSLALTGWFQKLIVLEFFFFWS